MSQTLRLQQDRPGSDRAFKRTGIPRSEREVYNFDQEMSENSLHYSDTSGNSDNHVFGSERSGGCLELGRSGGGEDLEGNLSDEFPELEFDLCGGRQLRRRRRLSEPRPQQAQAVWRGGP